MVRCLLTSEFVVLILITPQEHSCKNWFTFSPVVSVKTMLTDDHDDNIYPKWSLGLDGLIDLIFTFHVDSLSTKTNHILLKS